MKEQTIEKSIKRKSFIFLFIGIILFAYGIIRYLFISPEIGTNLMTQLPTMIDGSISFVIGLGMTLGAIHSLMNRNKLAEDKKIENIEKRKAARNNPKWLKHY